MDVEGIVATGLIGIIGTVTGAALNAWFSERKMMRESRLRREDALIQTRKDLYRDILAEIDAFRTLILQAHTDWPSKLPAIERFATALHKRWPDIYLTCPQRVADAIKGAYGPLHHELVILPLVGDNLDGPWVNDLASTAVSESETVEKIIREDFVATFGTNEPKRSGSRLTVD